MEYRFNLLIAQKFQKHFFEIVLCKDWSLPPRTKLHFSEVSMQKFLFLDNAAEWGMYFQSLNEYVNALAPP